MRASLADWLASSQGRLLVELPMYEAPPEDTERAMRNRLSDAYAAGYTDGRESTQRRA